MIGGVEGWVEDGRMGGRRVDGWVDDWRGGGMVGW